MFTKIKENEAVFKAPVERKISSKLPVFYNPVMKLNRDISVLLLKSIENTELLVCDLMAGSGIRSIRFLAELPKNKIKKITINDYSKKSVEIIKENIALNKRRFKDNDAEISVENSEGSALLLRSTGFDYIDVDPFGSPNPFLDAAVRRISRRGILAVTATDTSALAGRFPDVCRRRYWSEPDPDCLKHEAGLRILIRKIQLVGAQYEKALIPVFSYSKDHYMRVFLRCEKGKTKADQILKKHGLFNNAGPLWLGALWDKNLVRIMYLSAENFSDGFCSGLLKTIYEESKIEAVGFHDIHALCKKTRQEIPKFRELVEEIRKKGFDCSKTHFSPYGVRSNISEKELACIIGKVMKRSAD